MIKNTMIALLVTTAAITANTAFAEIAGNYQCQALDPATGKTYTSVLKISENKKIYNLSWKFNDNKQTSATALLLTHQNTQVLSGVFIAERSATTPDILKEKHVGLIQYWVDSSTNAVKLTGSWLYSGTTDIGSERCQKETSAS